MYVCIFRHLHKGVAGAGWPPSLLAQANRRELMANLRTQIPNYSALAAREGETRASAERISAAWAEEEDHSYLAAEAGQVSAAPAFSS